MADNTVKGLYLSLGLDISELKAGFALADRTVNQAILRFNSEANEIRIKTNIDTLKAEDALEKLKVQYRGLGEEIEKARQKELLLQRDLQANQKALGADNPLTRKSNKALLQQQQAIAALESRQRSLGKTIETASSPWFKFAEALNAAKGGASGIATYLGAAAGPVAALTAVIDGGLGLAALTKGAADTAAAIGDLGDKFGMTKEQAAQLMGTTKAAGVDTEGFVTWLTRLDKTVTSAGASGNETTRTLARFGVSLTDSTGKLVNYNEQLRRMAEGFQNAKSVGQTEEFLAGLGRGAAQYADFFNKYESEYARRGNEMYGESILNAVEPAQELTDRLKELDEQLEQLKLAFGAVFVPVATELIPPIISGLKAIVEGASEAKHRLLDTAEEAAARRGNYGGGGGKFKLSPEAAAAENAKRAAEQREREAIAAAEAEKKAAQETAAQIEDIWRKATGSRLENDLAAIDQRMKKELEAADLTEAARARIEERYNAERQATLYKANQEMERMNRDLSDSIAKQTQGELANALRSIDRQAEATREKYKNLFGSISKETNALIQQNTTLQRQNAVQSRADKALTAEKEYWEIFKSIMNRPGGVPITNVEKSKSGAKFYTFGRTEDMSIEERMKAAENAIRAKMLEQRGITDPNVRTSDLQMFDQIMKNVNGGLANVIDDAGIMGDKIGEAVSNSLSDVSAKMAEGMDTRLAPALESLSNGSANYQSAALNEYQEIKAAISDLAAKMDEREAVAPQITVTIESAVTEDSASMTHLADTVADRISEVITQYVGTGANTY